MKEKFAGKKDIFVWNLKRRGKMKNDERIKNIDIDLVKNELSSLYNELRTKFAKNDIFEEDGIRKIPISLIFRKRASIENFKMALTRLEEFFIAVDYFKGNVEFCNKKNDYSTEYKNKFMYSLAIDSVTSTLDIFTKSIAWFFNIEGKEELGFNFKKFITPLKKYNIEIADILNVILNSPHYKEIKQFRNLDKHSGLGKNKYSMKDDKTKFEYKIERAVPHEFDKLDFALCNVFNLFISSIKPIFLEIEENLNYRLENETIGKIEDNGGIILLPRN